MPKKTNYVKYSGFRHTKTLTHGTRTDKETGKVTEFEFSDSYQDIYRASKKFDTDQLDDTALKVIEEDHNVKGILITLKVKDEDTGNVHYVSNYLNREQIYQQMEKDEFGEGAVYDHVTQTINAGYTEKMQLQLIYMRVVHEKSKES